MKRAILIVFEAFLFLFAFLGGSILPAFPASHLPLWTVDLSPTRYFVLDGLILMLALYLIFLAIGAIRHRTLSAVVSSTTALILALVLGLSMKFGLASR